MWNSSVDLLNMEAHHVPSLNQSLLWGFSPVGATTELALYEKSRYPMSLAADDVPAYPKRSTRTVNSGRAIRLMRCVPSMSTPDSRRLLAPMLLDGSATGICQVAIFGVRWLDLPSSTLVGHS